MIKPIPQSQWHNSQRGWFAGALYNEMIKDKDIIVVTGDLGYGLFDKIRDNFPDRFINTGAAEQSMMGIAVGLALEGKKPFVYSITPFLLWRPAETIRLYVNHEQVPVRLIGGGRDKDYAHDGISHDASDDKKILKCWPSIFAVWPTTKEQIPHLVDAMVENNKPWYLNLTR